MNEVGKKNNNSSAFQERHSSQQGTKKLTDVRIYFAKVPKITHLCGFMSGPLYFLPFFFFLESLAEALCCCLCCYIDSLRSATPTPSMKKGKKWKLPPKQRKPWRISLWTNHSTNSRAWASKELFSCSIIARNLKLATISVTIKQDDSTRATVCSGGNRIPIKSSV